MGTDLLVIDDHPDLAAAVFVGGLPMVPAGVGFAWPVCKACQKAMQFQCRVPHPTEAFKQILVFQCANAPGTCGEWEVDSGANQAIIVDVAGPISSAQPSNDGVATLGGQWSGHVEQVDADYEQARRVVQSRGQGGHVLGFLGGQPEWLQDDQTPDCPSCGQSMVLAAQLEEGPDYRIGMNFGGGGCGYVFACACPARSAAFLWQCG